MSFLNSLFKKDKPELKESTVILTQTEVTEENVAVMAAAIAVMLSAKSTNTDEGNEFIVRNIKQNFEIDSIWSHEGRMELMR